MLTLASIALIAPAFFASVMRGKPESHVKELSLEISRGLLITYGFSLLFSLRTHRHLYQGKAGEIPKETDTSHCGLNRAVLILLLATGGFVWMS